MTARWLRVLAVAALLVLAGCSAPVADEPVAVGDDATGATTASPTTDGPPEGVVVRGGRLDVDVNRTYDRVRRLVDGDYAGTRVVVRDLTAYKTADYGDVPFFRVFGVGDPALDENQPTGITTLDAVVYVSPAGADGARLEQVLAHEFVHVAQVREEMVPWFGGVSLGRVTLDERLAQRALVEGGAVYVTDAYTREYLPGEPRQSARIAAGYENGTAGTRLVWSQYHFGFRYVNATVDAPSALPDVYEDAPETTESVLHPGERDAPASLDVTVDAGEYQQVESPTVRAGELLTRITLRAATDRQTAANASEGWGNDRVVAFRTDGGFGVAWVTRWDADEDADEFAAAARELGTATDVDSVRVTRLDAETVVVFGGSEAFVDTATASGNVTVSA